MKPLRMTLNLCLQTTLFKSVLMSAGLLFFEAAFSQAIPSSGATVLASNKSKPSQLESTYVYRAKAGDTPESIAFEFLAQASKKQVRDIFYARNGIISKSSNKPVELNRPFNMLVSWMYLKPVAATVVSSTGLAKRSDPGAENNFINITGQGQSITEGSLIRTQDNSFVVLRLPDNSTLSVSPNSELNLETMKRYASSDIFKIQIVLNKGRVESDVIPLTNVASDYSVRSKRLLTGVRGTKFSVSDDPLANATAEVLQGAVQISDKTDKSLRLPKGFGSFVVQEKAADPIALLAAPIWNCTPGESIIQRQLPLTFTTLPNSYRVDVFSKSAGKQILELTALALPQELLEGDYRFSVRGADLNGIQGYSSEQNIRVLLKNIPPIRRWVMAESTRTWAFEESAAQAVKQFSCVQN